MQRTTGIKEELSKKVGQQKECGSQPDSIASQDAKLPEAGAIRLLRADEIECRVSIINKYGLRLLLFKDARVDQKILDEAFTPFGWKRTHQEIDGKLYCTVEVWDDVKQQWIAKQDVGTASYSEKEKGQASDSFKRACFNWGIGRELYTAPSIWIPASCTYIQEKDGRFITTERFSVQSIAYNEQREISALEIVDRNGKGVFQMPQKQPEWQTQGIGPQAGLLEQELERTGVSMETVLERYNIKDISQMTPEMCSKALSGLRKTKTKGAA